MKRGRFISFEGVDGAGKSSHIDWVAEYLTEQGIPLILTREPGGTPLGEQLRTLVLNEAMYADTETLLMFAARCEHLHQRILPALEAGTWVLCDRFTDATFAYQGAGRGMDWSRLEAIEHWVQAGLEPDLTLLFDLPVEVARERLDAAREPDRFEAEQAAFFERVREGYLKRAALDPQRFHILDASLNLSEVRARLIASMELWLETQHDDA